MEASDLVNKMIRAARLDVGFYEEVERDRSQLLPALTVVMIVAIAAGISSLLSNILAGRGIGAALLGLILGVIGAVIGWIVWSYLTYWIGTSFLGGTAAPGELLRTLGFANSPNVFQIFGFIPCLGWIIALLAGIWTLVAGIVAVRQALDFDTGKAIVTVIIGWIIVFILTAILATIGAGAAFLFGR